MVLLVMCVGARVGFDRKLIPLFLLIVLWLVGGLLSLIQVGDQAKDIQYAGTSIYLGIAAVMFACLFCDGNLVRLAILRRGYILAALIATAAGYIGFFHLAARRRHFPRQRPRQRHVQRPERLRPVPDLSDRLAPGRAFWYAASGSSTSRC